MADREPWSDRWEVRGDRVAVAVGGIHGPRRSPPVTVQHPSETLRVPFGDDDEAAAAASWTGTTPPDSARQRFRELLDADTHVELDKLVEAARAGVPTSVRGEVWKYLLGVAEADKSQELTYARQLQREYMRARRAALHALGVLVVGGEQAEEAGGVAEAGSVGATSEAGAGAARLGTEWSVLNHGQIEVTGASDAGALRMYGQALPGGLRIESGDELVRRIRGEARRRLERHRMQEQMAVRRRERGAVASSERRHRAVPRYASQRSVSSSTTPSAPALSGSKSPRYALALSETDRPSGSSVGSDGDGDGGGGGGSNSSSVGEEADDEGKYRDRQVQNAAAAVTEVSGDLARLDMCQQSPPAVTPRASTSSAPSSAATASPPSSSSSSSSPSATASGGSTRPAVPLPSSDVAPASPARNTPSEQLARTVQCYVQVLCTYWSVANAPCASSPSPSTAAAVASAVLASRPPTSPTDVDDRRDGHDADPVAPVEYSPVMVSLVHAFAQVFPIADEGDIFYCFYALMRRRRHQRLFSARGDALARAVAHFLMLFRTLLPDLADFFESEEIDPKRWLHGWLQGLFARGELPMASVLRLWDVYLACGLDTHPYVCLAVLDLLQEELAELDGPEVVGYLSKLPDGVDVEQVLTRAVTIREMAYGRGLMAAVGEGGGEPAGDGRRRRMEEG